MISILLADDQALIRLGFTMVLASAPDLEVVGEAADGLEAVTKAQELQPDVVLMDVRMPGIDGVEATRRITETTEARVLILTTFDLDEYAYTGLEHGASGFLLKDVLPETLLQAIRAVADGDAVLTPRLTREFVNRVQGLRPAKRARSRPRPPLDRLTVREREVLELVASGLSNAQIAGALVVTEATVKTHVTRILAKLEIRDRVQAVIYAYDVGLRLPEP